jgi:hypothetical protein
VLIGGEEVVIDIGVGVVGEGPRPSGLVQFTFLGDPIGLRTCSRRVHRKGQKSESCQGNGPHDLLVGLSAFLARLITRFCFHIKAIALRFKHMLFVFGEFFTREQEVELIPAKLSVGGFGLALRRSGEGEDHGQQDKEVAHEATVVADYVLLMVARAVGAIA